MKVNIKGVEVTVVFRRNMKYCRLRLNSDKRGITVSCPPFVSEHQIRKFVLKHIDKYKQLIEKHKTDPTLREIVESQIRYECSRTNEDTYQIFKDRIIIEYSELEHIEQSKEQAVVAWAHIRLFEIVKPMVLTWSEKMGVMPSDVDTSTMKSRWGVCNVRTKAIRFSIELLKKSEKAIELVVVHELAHLIEASHNARFKAIMTKFLPDWKIREQELKGKID